MVGAYLRYFTFLTHEEILALDAVDAPSTPNAARPHRVLAREVCTLVHGADEAARAEQAAAALFGGDARRPRRADPARRVRRRALHRPRPAPAGRGRLLAGRPPGRDGPGRVEEPGPDHGRPGRGLREQPRGRTTSTRRLDARRTWSPTATWCCGGARRTTTWSASPDGGRPDGRRARGGPPAGRVLH